MKKFLIFTFLILFWTGISAQNEFITVWKPGTSNLIHFPGKGTNYTIYWEEIGYPQHSGTLDNITSANEVVIDFGNAYNPVPSSAAYRVKVSKGNGNFGQIRFFDNSVVPIYSCPDMAKIFEVAQWGNTQWQTFENAFTLCSNLDVTATDAPNLSLVTSTKEMFYICSSLVGNASFNNWNTSTLTNINSMFSAADVFNAPIGSWDVSNVTDFRYVFDMALKFNQPLREWDTSGALTMEHMFHGAAMFNQNIGEWDTSGVTNMDMMFAQAMAFNQDIGSWNLSSLVSAVDMLNFSGLNCQNYDSTLVGWNNNPQTPQNINLGNAMPLYYKHPLAIAARTSLISQKNWSVTGDGYNPTCNSVLSASETGLPEPAGIYPNPASETIYLKNVKGGKNYFITDFTGRILNTGSITKGYIDIRHLVPGNYLLNITGDGTALVFKFIKK